MRKRSSFICTRVLHSLPAAERLLCLQEGWGALWDPSGSPASPRGMLLENRRVLQHPSWLEKWDSFWSMQDQWRGSWAEDSVMFSYLTVALILCNYLLSLSIFVLLCLWSPSLVDFPGFAQTTSLAWGPCWGLLYSSSLTSVIFLRNSGTSSSLLSRFLIYRCSSSSYMIITSCSFHSGILEQCFLKTWSITILWAGKQ